MALQLLPAPCRRHKACDVSNLPRDNHVKVCKIHHIYASAKWKHGIIGEAYDREHTVFHMKGFHAYRDC